MVSREGKIIGVGINEAPLAQGTDFVHSGGDPRTDELMPQDEAALRLFYRGHYDWRRSPCGEKKAIWSAMAAGHSLEGARLYTTHNPWIQVRPEAYRDVCEFLKGDPALAFDYIVNYSAVDRKPLDELLARKKKKPAEGEEPEPEPAVTGRYEAVVHLFSLSHRHHIAVKARPASDDDPSLPSLAAVWRGADWQEREAFDMMGIRFEGHPDHRRVLLPDDWEGHPLRKDYEFPETYREMPVMGTPAEPEGYPIPDEFKGKRHKKEEG